MLRHCLILLLASGALSTSVTNGYPENGCSVNGSYYQLWETWNGEVGDCAQYKCTSRGIGVKRCTSFLDSLGPSRFQEFLNILDGTKCVFDGADYEKPYPECCNKIMCLDVIDPVAAAAAEDTTTAPTIAQ